MSYQEQILEGLVVDSIAAAFVKKSFTKWGFNLEDTMAFLSPDPDDIRTAAINFSNEFLTPGNPHSRSLICINDERGIIAFERIDDKLFIIMNESGMVEGFQSDDAAECIELIKGSADELISHSILGYFDGIKTTLPDILHPVDEEESTKMAEEFFGVEDTIFSIDVEFEV